MVEFYKDDFGMIKNFDDEILESCNKILNEVADLESHVSFYPGNAVKEAYEEINAIVNSYTDKINYLENQLSLLKEENQKLNTKLNKVIDAIYK